MYGNNAIYSKTEVRHRFTERFSKDGMKVEKSIEEYTEDVQESINSLAIMVDYKFALANLQNPNTDKQGQYLDCTQLQAMVNEGDSPVKVWQKHLDSIYASEAVKPTDDDTTALLRTIAENTKKEKEKDENRKQQELRDRNA